MKIKELLSRVNTLSTELYSPGNFCFNILELWIENESSYKIISRSVLNIIFLSWDNTVNSDILKMLKILIRQS